MPSDRARPVRTCLARRLRSGALLLGLLQAACGGAESDGRTVAPNPCEDPAKAPATCLTPKQAPEHYVQQSLLYFDTLDVSAPKAKPAYAELAARWEWPPWLKLTGYGAQMLLDTAELVTKSDPSTVPTRECRAFGVQPFGRCHVVMAYAGGPCAIYEEFTFNDQGEITFIEAWTDAPGRLPMDGATDRWAEGPGVRRLSTRVPGLGSSTGRIDPDGAAMKAAATADPDVADFAERARDFWGAWFAEVKANGKDIYARGCGW